MLLLLLQAELIGMLPLLLQAELIYTQFTLSIMLNNGRRYVKQWP